MVEAEMTRKEQKKMESSSVCKSFNVQYTIYQEPGMASSSSLFENGFGNVHESPSPSIDFTRKTK